LQSVIYRSPLIYESLMLALYGRHYNARYSSIADLIPDGADVLDLCCGPASLYFRYLRGKRVAYRGLDLNSRFVSRLKQRGVAAEIRDLREERPLPKADYVVMQASLYHFLPDAAAIVNRMLAAARNAVLIAEPVKNLSSANLPLVASISRILTDPGVGPQVNRFTEQSLDGLFGNFSAQVRTSFRLPGGREKLFILEGASR
jgi:SAM-dependent methyltransferase